jgi:hypothetical protein
LGRLNYSRKKRRSDLSVRAADTTVRVLPVEVGDFYDMAAL